MRQAFVTATTQALASDDRVALLLAQISSDAFADARRRYRDRVIDVGIREQLMLGVAAGLAAEGMRPVVHSYAPFLVERPFESLKVDLAHQDLGAVLVSVGASYDVPAYGRTHACPEDVALLDALTGWTVSVPGHPQEVGPLLSSALAGGGRAYIRLSEATNREPQPIVPGRLAVLRRGGAGTVLAVGPMLDPTLEAVAGLDVTVLYASTLRPLDAATLNATLAVPRVVVVEPLLAGTSLAEVSRALGGRPAALLGIGVENVDLHRYGSRRDHDLEHGLDAASLRRRIISFVDEPNGGMGMVVSQR